MTTSKVSVLMLFAIMAVFSISYTAAYASNGGAGPGYAQSMEGDYNHAGQSGSYHVPYPPTENQTGQYQPHVPYPPTANQTGQYQPPVPFGKGCSAPMVTQAQSELASAEQDYQNLKSNFYQKWKQLNASGEYNGTWDQYSKENIVNSTEGAKMRQIHEQYGGFVQYCYPAPQGARSTPIALPVTGGSTVAGNISSVAANSTGSVAPSPKQVDMLMELEPPSTIPVWVKNNAKWWSQDQISDSEFISALHYLVSHKIIQVYPSLSVNNTSTVLPDWVKGVAGAWANGSISNDYFVTTVQYMSDQNILKMQ